MSAYLLGLATLPALALAGWALFWAWIAVTETLDSRFGISFDLKVTRDVDGISDYVLRNNIWWERSLGPVFAGGWYREPSDQRLFNRWIGIGRADGPCWIAYRKRDLGAATAAADAGGHVQADSEGTA